MLPAGTASNYEGESNENIKSVEQMRLYCLQLYWLVISMDLYSLW